VSVVEQTLGPVSDCRVLVVDDNPANTTLVSRILHRAGLPDVIEVQNPMLVHGVLQDAEPDIVLLDLRMPVMDGFEVLDMIRRQAAGNYLPVIVITADDSHQSVERALNMGAHDFLSKPFNATELVLRVRNLLINRMAYQELRRSRAWLRTRLDLFEPDLAQVSAEPEVIRELINDTIATGAFQVAIQPVVDMRDGSLVSAEALARFPNGILGNTGAWFAAALEVGLVTELELATARRAVELIGSRPEGTSLAVNLSPSTVLVGVEEALGGDIPWDRIIIELTEHAPVVDYVALNAALAPIREQGARVAVDDTGAGFASLRHILDLHPDIIKVDIGITRGIDVDPSRAAIAGMLIRFADEVGIRVVAEGIETESERDTLLSLGAHFGQGYLLGRPVIAE
jgi:EAL domain-containing protein (putative c-di-GMP-specific phosphodiesterase class I)/DNA-binding NarL/FixJ family response regulator